MTLTQEGDNHPDDTKSDAKENGKRKNDELSLDQDPDKDSDGEEENLGQRFDQDAASADTNVTSNTTNDGEELTTMKQRLQQISLEIDQQNTQYRRILQHPPFPNDSEAMNQRTDHPQQSDEPRSSSDEESLDGVEG